MKYFQTWQDFMRMPANKALKESKGIHACKQRFIQEQNKMQWYDPIMLTENGDAGESVPSAAGGGGGNSLSFITGQTAEVSTYTFATTLDNGATGSMNYVLEYNTIQQGVDFSFASADSRKKVGIFILTGSNMAAAHIEAIGLSTSQYDIVVTASMADPYVAVKIANDAQQASASIALTVMDNFAGAAANQVVCGFTNPTLTPSDLGTFTTGSRGTTLVFTGNKGGVTDAEVDDAQTVSGLSVAATHAATGSIATTTDGNDTYFGDEGEQVFNGQVAPFTSMPRKY